MAYLLGKHLQKLMYNLGQYIGKYPSYFIIIPLFICLLFGTGLQNIKYQNNVDYLYLPSDGRFVDAKKSLNELYPMNYSSIFSKERLIDNSKYGKVIITSKDNQTLFREQVLWEIILLDRIIRNLTIDYDDFQLTFDDICAKLNEQCYNSNTILDLAMHIKEIESNSTLITYPSWFDSDSNITYYFHNQIGGLTLSKKDSIILNVKAIQLNYYLDLTIKYGDELAKLWEQKFLDVLKSLEDQFDYLNIASYTSFSTSDELEQNLHQFVQVFSLTFALILIFGFLSSLMLDCVRSKPCLGILQCLTPLLGLIGAFGCCAYIGIEMIKINWIILYILLANSMQDSFILISVWRRTLIQLSVRERLAATYSESYFVITINAFINCSFYIISYFLTNIKAIQIFCIYISLSLIFIYIIQLTMFGSLIAIFGYIEKRNLNSLICVPVLSKSSATNNRWFFNLFCTGGINLKDPDNKKDNKSHILMIFFRDTFAKLINNKLFKIIILLIFIGHLSIGIYNLLNNLDEGFNKINLFNNKSYAFKFNDYDQKYFTQFKYPIQVIFNETLDYSDTFDQFKIEQFLNKIENNDFISKKSTQCWIKSYLRFVQLIKRQRNRPIQFANYNLTRKNDFYNLLKDVFLSLPANFIYRSDIIFNENLNEIISSRCIVFSGQLLNSTDEKNMLDTLYKLADSSKMNVTFYNPNFGLFEQYSQIKDTTINFLILLIIVMFVNCILFLPSINIIFWLILIVISIELGFLSYLSLWNLNLNYITMLVLMMNIVFSVNCLIHVSCAYFESINYNIKKKIRNTLFTIGYPLTQSYLLKLLILFTIILSSTSNYLFSTLSKLIIILIALCSFHELLLLPVLLSLNNLLCKKSNDYSNEKHLNDSSDLDDQDESENDFDHKSRKSYYYKSSVRQRLHEQPPFFYSESWFDGKMLTTTNRSTVTIPRLIMKQPKSIDDDLNHHFLSATRLNTINSRSINNNNLTDQVTSTATNQQTQTTKPNWKKDQEIREDVIRQFNEHWNLNSEFRLNSKNKQQTGLQVNLQSNESGLGTSAEENSEGSYILKNKDKKTNQNSNNNIKTNRNNNGAYIKTPELSIFNGKSQFNLFNRNQQPPLPPIPVLDKQKDNKELNIDYQSNSRKKDNQTKNKSGIPGAREIFVPSTYKKKKKNQDWIDN